ncbi:hypothetical protein BHM03_00045033 [Ensete ventricosum]|nr:hypothetical protein BHM03_00045033 [Ensete ventricosum]
MEILESYGVETVGIAVAVVAVAAGAAYFFFGKKSKESFVPSQMLCFSFTGSLDPDNFKDFKLVEKNQLSHNVAKFRFALPTPTSVLGLPIGQHISCRLVHLLYTLGKDNVGEEVIKPYTPTTLDSDVGYFELVIKYQVGQVRAFGMLAGGSGITPMFQVTRAILENPTDKTKVHLIYANVTYEDILLKEELDSLARNYPDRFQIYYILRCGPPPMNKAMAAHLDDLGYTKEMQFQF